MENTNVAKLSLQLKNNGSKEWLKDAKLKVINTKGFLTNNLFLKKQKPKEIDRYELIFCNLKGYPPAEYISKLGFYIEGKQYGEKLEVKINIIKKG